MGSSRNGHSGRLSAERYTLGAIVYAGNASRTPLTSTSTGAAARESRLGAVPTGRMLRLCTACSVRNMPDGPRSSVRLFAVCATSKPADAMASR
jgi:hypothetical protein